jgi:hypothetical protein
MAKKRLLGSVDLLGLNGLGENPGLNPIFGTLIGGGVTSVTSLALRHAASGKAAEYADAIGFAAGVAASLGMYGMKGTRHAAFASLAGAVFASGLRALEKMLSSPMNGVGIPMIEHLGIPQITALNGNFGMHQLGPIQQSWGTIPGVAGTTFGLNNAPPVDLLGEQSPLQQQAVLLGGPQTSGMANHYGANLFGGRS